MLRVPKRVWRVMSWVIRRDRSYFLRWGVRVLLRIADNYVGENGEDDGILAILRPSTMMHPPALAIPQPSRRLQQFSSTVSNELQDAASPMSRGIDSNHDLMVLTAERNEGVASDEGGGTKRWATTMKTIQELVCDVDMVVMGVLVPL